jgi:3-hydroxyisobutyrate dehydrogenase-like beta-hydroxyacid dehydrogenase
MSVTNAVGLIGLGAMGRGMASSLRRASYAVHVCDARPGAAAEFAADGGVACASPAEVAAACPVVISVVVNAAQTESVLFGDHGAAAAMAAGSVFVMCSTVDPNWSIALEARLQQLGLLYLDAPISGGAAKSASGQMTMMTSGTPAAYALCEPMLNAMAASVYKLGDKAGAGSKVKIINQLLAGVHIAAAAEAMALGLREGVTRPLCTRSSPTARATAGCLKTAWRMCWRLITRRCLRWIFLSKTWGLCWTWRAPANFRYRSRAPHTKCSCKPAPPGLPKKTTAL